jgi:hypothetical protein
MSSNTINATRHNTRRQRHNATRHEHEHDTTRHNTTTQHNASKKTTQHNTTRQDTNAIRHKATQHKTAHHATHNRLPSQVSLHRRGLNGTCGCSVFCCVGRNRDDVLCGSVVCGVRVLCACCLFCWPLFTTTLQQRGSMSSAAMGLKRTQSTQTLSGTLSSSFFANSELFSNVFSLVITGAAFPCPRLEKRVRLSNH